MNCSSCALYLHSIMMCHYPTIALNYSYVVHLLACILEYLYQDTLLQRIINSAHCNELTTIVFCTAAICIEVTILQFT